MGGSLHAGRICHEGSGVFTLAQNRSDHCWQPLLVVRLILMVVFGASATLRSIPGDTVDPERAFAEQCASHRAGPDGYIWAETLSGVAKFDGIRLKVF